MGVDRLPGDEKMHDLRGALEDPVDSQVAQHLLGGYTALTTGSQGLGGLETAPTPDLYEFVDEELHVAVVFGS